MRPITLIAILIFSAFNSFSQNWDRPMQVKKMNITIGAGSFMATTFIEMEFYNPNDTEIEGLYRFELAPGQAITAFQLELFGKFRDGSIEEKWKASRAYNTIVGKKVDPALLQMDYYNWYSLRIYPVPAKGTRRITMTIQQLLSVSHDSVNYRLPLNIAGIIEQVTVAITVYPGNNIAKPVTGEGLLKGEAFMPGDSEYSMLWKATDARVGKAICFSIPLVGNGPSVCSKFKDNKTFFAIRLKQPVQREYSIRPAKIVICWDVSWSGTQRNTSREIEFLKEYVTEYNTSHLTIITFNQQTKDTVSFQRSGINDNQWINYLQSLTYEGAKQYGLLDFSAIEADAILLFSNGRNSFGRSLPNPAHTQVYCINSSYGADSVHLKKIIGESGGKYINLNTYTIPAAVEMAGKAENILFAVSSPSGPVNIDQSFSGLRDDVLLISGNTAAAQSSLTFYFGNNNNVHGEKTVTIGNSLQIQCDVFPVDRIPALSVFDTYARNWQWPIEFGKKEKMVTTGTSFIVLEKLEDYIKFNITPPKDLESECDMNLFVDAAEKRKQENAQWTEWQLLSFLADTYNEKIKWWNPKESMLSLKKQELPIQETALVSQAQPAGPAAFANTIPTQGLPPGTRVLTGTEVVVTALGQTRQPKELGYAVSKVRYPELTQAKPVNLQQGLTGKVSGLLVQTVNNSVFADTRITLRGIRSLTGNNEPLLVLDGLPLPISYMSRINVNDILYVTILKSNAATAEYGPDGVNGAIVVTTRRGSRWSRYAGPRGLYKLKECDDVDYLGEIKAALYNEKISLYHRLRATYGHLPGFYFDMAEHLYQQGFRKEALSILYSAADVSNGNRMVKKATGYILESMGQYAEAVTVYRELLGSDSTDLQTWRDLALSYYQQGGYQESVNTFYHGLTRNNMGPDSAHRNLKSMMLQEMNAIIAIHRDSLDISGIRKELIRVLPVDLRITLDCNTGDLYKMVSVAEPGRVICSYYEPFSKNGGRLSRDPDRGYANTTADEYQVKTAKKGRYRIRVNYTDSWYGNSPVIPSVIKITTFRNMGSKGQTMEVSFVIMDNQDGLVEIGEVKW